MIYIDLGSSVLVIGECSFTYSSMHAILCYLHMFNGFDADHYTSKFDWNTVSVIRSAFKVLLEFLVN